MKSGKIIKLSVALTAVLGISLWLFQSEKSEEKLYQAFDPEEFSEMLPAQGIRGAILHYARIRGDVETGNVNQMDVYNALQYLKYETPKSKKNLGIKWNFAGPDNIGGRTRTLVIDKDDPKILYTGAVSGGFYKSTDGGNSWKAYSGEVDNLAINCMIQTPDGVIYYGTGEQNFTRGASGWGSSGVIGLGMWKSTDRGETFTHIESTSPSAFPGEQLQNPWNNVNALAWAPNPNPGSGKKDYVIFAGSDRGLQVSDDGGDTWSNNFPNITGNTTRICSEIRVSIDGSTVYVVTHTGSGGNLNNAHLYRSTQYGQSGTFVQIGNQLSEPGVHDRINPGSSRMIVAISPTDPNFVYVSSANTTNLKLEGVYQSKNAGDTWKKIGEHSGGFYPMSNLGMPQGQGDYDNIIAVCPKNPERIFLGGVHYWKWSAENGWTQAAGLFRGGNNNPYFIHADKHHIVFDTTKDPYIKYITTDGGITRSADAQNKLDPTYTEINRGYATTQYYAVAASRPSSVSKYGDIVGGTQDNSNILIDGTGFKGKTGYFISGGDGAFTEISKISPNVFFIESQYGGLMRSLDRGQNNNTIWDDDRFSGCTQALCPFVTPFRLWEKLVDSIVLDVNDNPIDTIFNPNYARFFFAVNQQLWMIKNPLGDSYEWFRLDTRIGTPSKLPGFSPNHVEYTTDGDIVYLGGYTGFNNAAVFRVSGLNSANFEYVLDTSGNYYFDPAAEGIKTELIFSQSGQRVIGLAVDPKNDDRLIVTMGNYGNQNYVYFSNNATDTVTNVTFTSVHGTGLPRIPIYDAIFSSLDPSHVILATEMGVFATENLNGSATVWSEENLGMHRVPTFMIRRLNDFDPLTRQETDDFRMYVATHGRGIYVSDVFSEWKVVSTEKDKFTIENAPKINVFPNPANFEATISFELNRPGKASVHIFDLQGRKVDVINYPVNRKGKNNVSFNVEGYNEGIYIIRLVTHEYEQSARLIIKRQ